MDTKKIKTLINLMKKSGLTALEISEGDTKIRLEKNAQQPMQTPPAAQTFASAAKNDTFALQSGDTQVVDFNNITEVKSPLVGVFYAASSPASKPYVKIGSRVKKGDVLCIVEAMKLMNEIICETDGEIVDICVQNGQVVEFSQVLFKIF